MAETSDAVKKSTASEPPPIPPRAGNPPPLRFRRKPSPSASSNLAAGLNGRPPIPSAPGPDAPAGNDLLDFSASSAFLGYAASILLHAVVLVVLAIIVFPDKFPLSVLIIEGTSKKVGIKTLLQKAPEISLTTQGGKKVNSLQKRPPSYYTVPRSDTGRLPSGLVNSIDKLARLDSGKGNAEGPGNDNDGQAAAPFGTAKKGRNAVTKGSFTAWTVPEKPRIRQPYFIIIEVKIPKKLGNKYQATDLSGKVVGTDTYQQTIPWDERLTRIGDPRYIRHTFRMDPRRKVPVWLSRKSRFSYLPVMDGRARLIIKVPGADFEKIEDTIKLRSKVLNEEQTLKIVF